MMNEEWFEAVMKLDDIHPHAKLVLYVLGSADDGEKSNIETIVLLTNVAERRARKYLAELERAGWVAFDGLQWRAAAPPGVLVPPPPRSARIYRLRPA